MKSKQNMLHKQAIIPNKFLTGIRLTFKTYLKKFN